ncbi:unnamed protein product [Rhizophagus irregularis]|nr:unnamed protein product [Rhizophagus irregularis]
MPQGEIISPLLWVIYIDPLLTVLKSSMVDPYSFNILNLPTSFSPALASAQPFQLLVFMNDSTLIASSKAGPEHMLSITEKFYYLNNTAANHSKYILVNNAIADCSSAINPPSITFNLKTSSLKLLDKITITPVPAIISFRFLGV